MSVGQVHLLPSVFLSVCFFPSPVPPVASQVQLELPHQRSLRTVIERMKGIDKFLFVDADMGGQLVFRSASHFSTLCSQQSAVSGSRARRVGSHKIVVFFCFRRHRGSLCSLSSTFSRP